MIACGLGPYLKYCTTNILDGELRWDASHLCGHSHCVRPSHIILELHLDNLARQNCEGNERCVCGDNPDVPGFGHRCLGHRKYPDTCPELLRHLIDRGKKLLAWKKWIIDDGNDPLHPPEWLRFRETETESPEFRLRKAREAAQKVKAARAEAKAEEATQTTLKRKADEEPVEKIQKVSSRKN